MVTMMRAFNSRQIIKLPFNAPYFFILFLYSGNLFPFGATDTKLVNVPRCLRSC